jgi:ABC-type transport system involved in cytochrome c biogenesis ATPase subunit
LRITIRQLAKAYGLLWALRDVSFDLAAGDLVALLGPNGAGKTTLLKLLGGLLQPTSGAIHLDGESLNQHSTAWRARIGFLVPGEHLYENLTVRENLEFFAGLYQKNISDAAIDQALQAVNLSGRSNEFGAALSSGMKCRLAIAKWLVDPENPLTTRVIVNRLRQHHFGEGLSRTPSDFGVMSDRPSPASRAVPGATGPRRSCRNRRRSPPGRGRTGVSRRD